MTLRSLFVTLVALLGTMSTAARSQTTPASPAGPQKEATPSKTPSAATTYDTPSETEAKIADLVELGLSTRRRVVQAAVGQSTLAKCWRSSNV